MKLRLQIMACFVHIYSHKLIVYISGRFCLIINVRNEAFYKHINRFMTSHKITFYSNVTIWIFLKCVHMIEQIPRYVCRNFG